MKKLMLEPEKSILVTIHRQENTDDIWRLENIVKAVKELSKIYANSVSRSSKNRE